MKASAATRGDDAVRGPLETPAATYRLLVSKGLRSDEAGNLTAYLRGLSPVEGGWQPSEIARLLFLRHLVEQRSEQIGRTDLRDGPYSH